MSDSMNYKFFINWAWPSGGSGTDLILVDPAAEREFGRVAIASAWDLDDALTSPRNGLLQWSSTPADARGELVVRAARIMKGNAEAAAAALSREQGKTLSEAKRRARACN